MYCDFFEMAFEKILDYWRRLKTRSETSKKLLLMTEKFKTVIGRYYL